MRNKRKNYKRKIGKRDNGFTMVEIIVVVAIIAILALMVAPKYFRYVERAKGDVCQNNRAQLERTFYLYLIENKIDRLEADFSQYLRDYYDEKICPDKGDISYINGVVRCGIHSAALDVGESDDEQDESVPYV
jgi:prepilin-type N-terminal cleavage/methylation domain-containing protein